MARAGIPWGRLYEAANEIVVFGSVAAGVSGPSSDLDLLAVGAIQPRKTSKLDLIIRNPAEIQTPEWLGSELAGHIAAYGIWLKGQSTWASQATLSTRALDRKRARIARLIAATKKYWERLNPEYRRSSLLTIRREYQRAILLEQGIPIPPTAVLDADYDSGKLDSRWTALSSISLNCQTGFCSQTLDDVIRKPALPI